MNLEHIDKLKIYKEILRIGGYSTVSKFMQFILVGHTYTVVNKTYGINGLAEHIIILSLMGVAGMIMSSIQPIIIKNLIDDNEKQFQWFSLKKFLFRKEVVLIVALGYTLSLLLLKYKTEGVASIVVIIKMAIIVIALNVSILCDSYFIKINKISLSHFGQIIAALVTILIVLGVEGDYLFIELLDLTLIYVAMPSLLKICIYIFVNRDKEEVWIDMAPNKIGLLVLSGVMGYVSGFGLPIILSEYMGIVEIVKLGTAIAIFNQLGSLVPLICSYFWPKIAYERKINNEVGERRLLRYYYFFALAICLAIFFAMYIFGELLLKIWMPEFVGFNAKEWLLITLIMNLYIIQTFLNYRVYSIGEFSQGAKVAVFYAATVIICLSIFQPESLAAYLAMQSIVLVSISIVPLWFTINNGKTIKEGKEG